MPKKDGTPTKAEIRQAEMYDRMSKAIDHARDQSQRFKALGFEVDCFVGELKLKPEAVDEILDRLEDELDEETVKKLVEHALVDARSAMRARGISYDGADLIAEAVNRGIRKGLVALHLTDKKEAS